MVIFADHFLRKSIAKLFRKRGLSVKSGSNQKLPKSVDYIVDCFGSRKAISLAQKQNTKYLQLMIGQHVSPPLEKINWRVVRTDFLVGPQMPTSSFLGQLISSAVKNKVLEFPGSSSEKIYPLQVNDLAEAVWQALVTPGTTEKEFLVLGQSVELGKLANFLQQLSQTTQGIHFSSKQSLPQYFSAQIQETNQQLNWQPKIDWQVAIEKAFRYFWKKIEPEKITILTTPEIPAPTPVPIIPKKVKKTKKKLRKEKEEETIIIEEPLEEKVKKIISQFEEKPPLTKPKTPPAEVKNKKPRQWQYLLIFLLFGLAVVLSVWLKPTVAIGLGSWQLKKTLTYLKSQSWAEAEISTRKAKNHFWQAENFLKNHRLSCLFLTAKKSLGQIAETGKRIAAASENAVPLAKNALILSEAILKDQDLDFNAQIQQIQTQQSQLSAELTLIEAFLKNSWHWLPLRWRHLPKEWAAKIENIRKPLAKGEKLLSNLPWIIGLDNQRRTFLVLLQNNMELRPTGGFIGSFALLTFEDGALTNFDVKDVYTADGQLKGHVEPPREIKEILGEANWYLRDSNWNPNFPKTAKSSEWFLKKELGREVDGTIGFNLEAAKKIISAFGEVYLPDFNEKIDANNLFERAEFWSENESFPGSDQKMAFLGLLGKQLFENIKAARPEEHLKITQAIMDSLEEKEILIFTHNSQLNKTLYQLNWDGSIRTPRCNLDNCFADYLYLVEANLGVNKANYFLRRTLEQAIEFKENGEIGHQLKINYENTAVSESWPGGKYLSWLRVYLPKQSKIEEIVAYDPLNAQNRKIIGVDKRKEEIADGKEVIGFQVKVPIRQRLTVEIRFSQQQNTNNDKLGYLLYWQKQSGYRETPVSLLVSFPENWQPLQVNPSASLVSGKLLFNQQLDKDLNFGVEFGK